MKKRLCVLLALAVLFMAGCSQSSAPQGGGTQDMPVQQQETAEISALRQVKFETSDMNGNKISSEELFGAHKITMVNVWASWCGPCVGELPDLEELNKKLEGKDCAVVGLLLDGSEEEGLSDARELAGQFGLTYTILLPWDGYEDDFPAEAVPTSFFVDSSGNILDIGPIVGAYVEGYESAIDSALSNM